MQKYIKEHRTTVGKLGYILYTLRKRLSVPLQLFLTHSRSNRHAGTNTSVCFVILSNITGMTNKYNVANIVANCCTSPNPTMHVMFDQQLLPSHGEKLN